MCLYVIFDLVSNRKRTVCFSLNAYPELDLLVYMIWCCSKLVPTWFNPVMTSVHGWVN